MHMIWAVIELGLLLSPILFSIYLFIKGIRRRNRLMILFSGFFVIVGIGIMFIAFDFALMGNHFLF